jgi:hypothetical protein
MRAPAGQYDILKNCHFRPFGVIHVRVLCSLCSPPLRGVRTSISSTIMLNKRITLLRLTSINRVCVLLFFTHKCLLLLSIQQVKEAGFCISAMETWYTCTCKSHFQSTTRCRNSPWTTCHSPRFSSHISLWRSWKYTSKTGLVCPWSCYGMQDQKELGTVERVWCRLWQS